MIPSRIWGALLAVMIVGILPPQTQGALPLEVLVYSGDSSVLPNATSMGNVSVPISNERGDFLFVPRNPIPSTPSSTSPALVLAQGGGISLLANGTDRYPGHDNVILDLPTSFHLNDEARVFLLREHHVIQTPFPPEDVPVGPTLWVVGSGGSEFIARRYQPAPGIPTIDGFGFPYFDFFSDLHWNNNNFHVFRATVHNLRSYGTAYFAGRSNWNELVHWNDNTNATAVTVKVARDVDVGYFDAIDPSLNPFETIPNSLFRFIGSQGAHEVVARGSPLNGRPQGVEHLVLLDVDELGNALFEGRNANLERHTYGLWMETLLGEGSIRLVPFQEEFETSEGPLTLLGIPPRSAMPAVPRLSGGHAVFLAWYEGLGNGGLGLFKVASDGKIRRVFGPGTLPGTAFRFEDMSTRLPSLNFAVNTHGLTAFLAEFTQSEDGSPPTPIRMGLWVEDTGGLPHLVLSHGEQIDVYGQQLTVEEIGLDGATALTDNGVLTFHVWFAEGGSAILRTTAPGAVSLTGYIRGKVRSALPTLTPEEHAVHQSLLTVYEQPYGRIRESVPGETDANYQSFIRTELGRAVRKLRISRDADGGFFVSGLNALKEARDGVVRNAFYTLELTGGETAEWVQNEAGEVDDSRVTPLYFLPKLLINVSIPTVDARIDLQPLDEIGIKQNLADRLSELAPINWAQVEDQVDAHLTALLPNPSGVTEAQREGLRRAIWAERAFVQAADFSDELIQSSLQSLGSLLADILGEILKSESDALKDSKKRVDNAKAEISPTFNGSILTSPELVKATSGADWSMVAHAELMGVISNLLKATKPWIIEGLVKSGMERARAQKIADALFLVVRSVLNGAKDSGMNRYQKGRASLSLALQEGVKLAVREAHPLLYDSDPQLDVSFATQVSPTLQRSVEKMTQWSTHDEAAFTVDKERFLQRLDKYIQDQNDYLTIAHWAQGLAEGFSSAEGGFGAIGAVVKWGKVVEKASKAAKYIANIEGVLAPWIAVYVNTPDELDALTHLAFGQSPPVQSQRTGSDAPRISIYAEPASSSAKTETIPSHAQSKASPAAQFAPMALSVAPPNSEPVSEALNRIAAALIEDQTGDAANDSVNRGAPESLTSLYASWKRDQARFEMTAFAIAAVSTDPTVRSEITLMNQLRFTQRVEEAGVGSALGTLFEGILSGTFRDTSDPAYLAARANALAALTSFQRVLTRSAAQSQRVAALLANSPNTSPPPAVLILEPGLLFTDDIPIDSLTTDPQIVRVQLTAFNPGSLPLPELPLTLQAWGLNNGVSIPIPTQILPPLEPGSEVSLEWTLTATGASQGGAIALTIDASDDAPSSTPDGSILIQSAEWLLPVHIDLRDSDADGIPDSEELVLGLDPNVDDASLDVDGDGLTNFQEYELGTDPLQADTDGDGLTDLEELLGSIKGEPTNPLVADTDGDGVNDLNDGAPLDPSSAMAGTAQTSAFLTVESHRIILTPESPNVRIVLGNSGSSPMRIRVDADDPGLFHVTTSEDSFFTGGGADILVSAPHPFPTLPDATPLKGSFVIHNTANSLAQSQRIEVFLASSTDIPVHMTIESTTDGIRVCWSFDSDTVVLEQARSLSEPIEWSVVPTSVQEINGQSCVLLLTDSNDRFYRLREP